MAAPTSRPTRIEAVLAHAEVAGVAIEALLARLLPEL